MIRKYECAIFFNSDLDEAVLTQEVSSVGTLIQHHGGTVITTTGPRRVEMGYKIGKKKDGQSLIVEFSLDPAKIKEVNNALRLKETVLRFTIIVLQQQKTAV